jgi:glycosyltransferase involved in cell wall biosynthesis
MSDFAGGELSIVLPVYNEQENIARVIRYVHAQASLLTADLEMIAVNDGSRDGTAAELERLTREFSCLRIVTHQKNAGYGGALVSGIRAAKKDWVLLLDSDGQLEIASFMPVWPQREEYDVLLGYREKRADDPYRRMMGKIGNTLANLLLGRAVTDINCGLKLFRREHLQPLELSSTGGIINFEILYRLFRKDRTLGCFQFPVKHYPRQAGRSTGGDLRVILRIMGEGLRIVFSKN